MKGPTLQERYWTHWCSKPTVIKNHYGSWVYACDNRFGHNHARGPFPTHAEALAAALRHAATYKESR